MKNEIKKIFAITGILIYFMGILLLPAFARDSKRQSVQSKLDPKLRYLMRNQNDLDKNVSGALKKIGQENWIDVFIHCSAPNDLDGRDAIRVRSQTDSMSIAWVRLDQIETVASLPSVSYIKAASLCKPLLDESIPNIQVDRVRNGELGIAYTGKNVLVGIVDYGIDWSNPDFQDEVGNSRILYLWDQTEISFQAPNGVVYTQEEITKEIRGITTNHVLATDITGHGTHVAGIAAGNGRATGNDQLPNKYKGVAPEADLIVVKVGHSGFVHDTNISEGIDYILQKADELNRPVVINLSIGQQKGPHDGTSSFEKYIDQLMGDAGQILVVAAGNERNAPIHFKHDFQSENEIFEVAFVVDCVQESQFDYADFDIWYPDTVQLSVSMRTPTDSIYGPIASTESYDWETDDGAITIDNASGGPYSGNKDMNCWVRVSDTQSSGGFTDNLYPGTWTIVFQGQPGGRVDGWLFEASSSSWLSSQVDTTTLIAEPGNARFCLTVGSHVSRNEWPSLAADPWRMTHITVGALSDFSSAGPTRPNSINPQPRQKPEVTAPGEYILSSMTRDMDISVSNHHWVASDSVHWAQCGTSMAAPHMTGVVALLLEAQNNLTIFQIRNLIIQSQFTGDATWDLAWGFGKLDGYQMLNVLTSVSSEKSILPTTPLLKPNYPNPFNSQTNIPYQVSGNQGAPVSVSLCIYNVKGELIQQLVKTDRLPGNYSTRWDGANRSGQNVASGVYFCVLKIEDNILNRKLILLR